MTGGAPPVHTERVPVIQIVTPAGRAVLAAAAAVTFLVAAITMLARGDTFGITVGILSLALAGMYAPVAWVLAVRRTALTLTPDGIRPGAGGWIPWEDLERIAPTFLVSGDHRQYSLGVRLANAHRYAASFTAAERRASAASAGLAKFVGLITGVGKEMQGMPTNDTYGQIAWTRTVTDGFDVVWPASVLPQPPHVVAQQVIDYGTAVWNARLAATPQPPPGPDAMPPGWHPATDT